FVPRFSRDARQLLFLWNRLPGLNLWLISWEDPTHPRAAPLTGRNRINLSQTVDAARYRNRQIQFRGAIKAEVSGSDRAACFVLVSQHNRPRPTLSDPSTSPPARSSQWINCVIEARVDSDAEKIIVGGFLEGNGTAWMDDFKLAFRDDKNQWQPIQLVN